MSQRKCPYCPAQFGSDDQWTARDYLHDHITDAHQDQLPKGEVVGGGA